MSFAQASFDVAKETTGPMTAKALLRHVRLGNDGLYVHGRAPLSRPSYSDAFVFTLSARSGAHGGEVTSTMDVPGYVNPGHTSEREVRKSAHMSGNWHEYNQPFRPEKGFWSLSYNPRDRLIDVLELLPAKTEVGFRVSLDAGTNEYQVRADMVMNHGVEEGLHTDHFYLFAHCLVRGRTVMRSWLIDTSTCAHNTARFGCER